MGKVSGYISNELESRLIRLIELAEVDEIDPSSLTYKDGLKYTILNDPFILVSSDGKAEFNISSSQSKVIAEAMANDFFIGHERRKEQYNNLKFLLSQGRGINPAWPLVTAYYCAFFCAIDISKALNRVNINFQSSEMEIIKGKSSGDVSGLEKINNFSGIVSPECKKIKFSSTKSKPHVYAWDNLYHSLIKKALKEHQDWTELSTIKNILTGDKNWEVPSAVRNTWNYINPFLFNKRGEAMGVEFMKIAGKSTSAEYWLTSNYSSYGETHQAGSIALMCELLYEASNAAYSNLISEKKG